MKKKLSGVILMLALFVLMGMNALAADNPTFAASASALIVDAQTVQYTAVLPSLPASADGMLYLYELKPYQDTIPAGATPIGTAPLSQNPVFNFALNKDQGANSRLYTKFALAVNAGAPSMIAYPQYVTNPEKVAPRNQHSARAVKTTQNQDMTNLLLNGAGAANGTAPFLHRTVQLLCNDRNSIITHPYARGAIKDTHPISHQYYMFNAAEDAGIAALVADLTYYATGPGEDFLVGNEMNERIWNYMGWVDWDTYTREYANAFRVCYNAIKSTNGGANVYISLDQNWNRDRPTNNAEYYTYIDGKDFLDKFTVKIASEGNIDWGMGLHPYTVPLTNAAFWKQGGYEGSMVSQNKMVSFQNMSIVSAYMLQPQFLNRAGKPRDIIINEIGLDARQGENIQAAALAASWVAFEKNPMITQYMYLSNFGDGVDARLTPKALEVFNALGTPQEAAYLEWAKGIIGISDWGQVIH